jgi:RimJ/RimL family protein N-acetyltransferase
MFRQDAVPYRIETARSVIRCWSPKDAVIFQKALNASVDSLLPWLPWAKGEPEDYRTKIDTLRYFRGSFDLGQDFVYGIFTAEEDEVIGGCGLHTRAGKFSLEIGYWINKTYQNVGYATEITRALAKTAFELSDIDNIQIHCDVRNAPSLRVIEKVGFKTEGVLLHKQKDANGEFQDLQIAAFLREDYLRSDLKKEHIKAFNVLDEAIL